MRSKTNIILISESKMSFDRSNQSKRLRGLIRLGGKLLEFVK